MTDIRVTVLVSIRKPGDTVVDFGVGETKNVGDNPLFLRDEVDRHLTHVADQVLEQVQLRQQQEARK